jgi:hypothetical protein
MDNAGMSCLCTEGVWTAMSICFLPSALRVANPI